MSWLLNSYIFGSIPIPDVYARYTADSFSGTTWYDISGNNRNATVTKGSVSVVSTTGNGSTTTFNTLQGTTSDGILFPADVLPATYTLFHIARYTGTTNSRIFDGVSINWLSGFHANHSGVAYHNGWLTQSSRSTAGTNWVLSTDQNSLYRANRTTHGTSGGTASARLSINAGSTTEYSTWQCAEVVVYNRTLTQSEYMQVEYYLNLKYQLGLYSTIDLISTNLGMNINIMNTSSYSGSGTTIYDLSGNGLNATGASALTLQQIAYNQAYTTASTALLNTDTHSIFFSIHIDGTTTTWDKIFGYTPSGSDRSPGIWRWPSYNRIHWRYDPGNTGLNFTTNAVSTVDNPGGVEFVPYSWYYVGLVKNGATTTTYINGVSLGNITVANPKTAGNSTIQIFSAYTGGGAGIRHLHIYNKSLTSAEVLQNYNSIYPEIKYGL